MARVLCVFFVTAVAVACSPSRTNDAREYVDASPSAPVQPASDDPRAREVAGAVEKALVAKPELASRFAANADGFQISRDGVTSPGWRGAWTERAFHVGARLPEVASKPFEAGVGVSELYRLRLEQVGAREAALGLADGRAVYRDVYPSTDVTFVAGPERLEWAYTLRDDKAPAAFALKVTLPKNLKDARVDAHGAIEFLDAEGNALLRAPRPLAVDAAGTLRDANLTWGAGVLTVHLETRGLRYPIVLDPAIETFVWQARVQPPGARADHLTVYDSVRKRIVLFGGRSSTGSAHADTWEWDGVVWSLRATTGPSGRFETAFTFDQTRGVAVMFGGYGAGSPGTELWEWDGTTWFQRCTTSPCTTTRPSFRAGAAMAWDPLSKKSVLFGGWGGSTTMADTWTWDGTEWASVAGSGPSARQHHAMTYDTAGSRVLLFGGETGSPGTYLNDLWSFNGATWTLVTTLGTPPTARSTSAFAFRSVDGKALLFGGANSSTIFGDTLELTSSTNTWSTVSGAGATARKGISAAYDANRQAVVMFGGDYSGLFPDTWEFKAGKWQRPAGEIGGRRDASTAWDSWRNRIVLFGGYGPGFTRYNDTWEWTGFSWTETCTTSACIASRPSARSGSAAAYDSIRRKFVMFGGAIVGTTDETWEFDGDTWTRKCTTSPCTSSMPSIRTDSAAAFDSARGKFVLFGGFTPTGIGADETWEWDGNAWTRVCTVAPCSTNIPSARRGAAAAFDAKRGRVLLFGGRALSTATFYGDTWEYDGSTWVRVATTGPAARTSAKLAWDDVREKLVLFGGGASSSFADTWEWDGTSWTQTASSGPPARTSHTLNYDTTRRRIVAYGGTGASDPLGDTWEYYTRGGVCSLGADCATGFCVDGVCCEQLSCGTCQACNTVGSPGNCAPVISADDPDTCPAATSSCDATGACKKKQGQACTASTQCASGSCANGYCCNTACSGGCDVCNVTPGTCTVLAKGVTGVSCGAYFCDGVSGECPTACAIDTDCASGYYCAAGGICQARRSQGLSCNTASGGDCSVAGCRQCNTGLTCKDGYCCNGTCDGSCRTCAATPGTCTTVAGKDDPDTCSGTMTCSSTANCLKQNGQTCSAATDCASGNCVDGVCCNTACAGGCDVCNATAGTCTIVAQGGAGASPACGAFVCNGSLASCPTGCGN
ncbi:MAG: hypothetical protein HYV09_02185, partial [Deltaproteobacteria bacterium]|nr:hypothetical protein [Deltaproteobacteria bacterium]